MGIPVIICDDSSFARKQVARALPKGWDIDITFATNGQEAVDAIAAGKGDVIFLDLTMPVMDGFAVLEYIRTNDLPTMPIVISGDIQPDSYNKVMKLGAVTFIKKPLDATALCKTLDSYGLLQVLTNDENRTIEAETDSHDDFLDWCQEISNIAMGSAADLLSRAIDDSIILSIPTVKEMDAHQLAMLLQATITNNVYTVNQGFIGAGVSGETMITFEQQDISRAANSLGFITSYKQGDPYEYLMDISNILVGAFLKGIAIQFNLDLSVSPPEIFSRECIVDEDKLTNNTLAIELSYALGTEAIQCNQLVLFTNDSQQKLRQIYHYATGD